MGEFHKKILELPFKQKKIDGVTHRIVIAELNEILGITEEAKKEFEEIISPKYHSEPTGNRILKWFEKWFGEQQKT